MHKQDFHIVLRPFDRISCNSELIDKIEPNKPVRKQFTFIFDAVRGYKFKHLAINSTTAVAAEVRVNPSLPATAVVEFMAKWSNLCPRTVYFQNFYFFWCGKSRR